VHEFVSQLVTGVVFALHFYFLLLVPVLHANKFVA